jgi:predicted acyltransferase
MGNKKSIQIARKRLMSGYRGFGGGICFSFLAAFCWIIEIRKYKKWAFPLIVIGMNSILA